MQQPTAFSLIFFGEKKRIAFKSSLNLYCCALFIESFDLLVTVWNQGKDAKAITDVPRVSLENCSVWGWINSQ